MTINKGMRMSKKHNRRKTKADRRRAKSAQVKPVDQSPADGKAAVGAATFFHRASVSLSSTLQSACSFLYQHRYLIMMVSTLAMVAAAAADDNVDHSHDDDLFFLNPDGVEEGYVKACFRNAGKFFAFKLPIFTDENGGDRTFEYIGQAAGCNLSKGNGGSQREVIDCFRKATRYLFTRIATPHIQEHLAELISMRECIEGASDFDREQVATRLGMK